MVKEVDCVFPDVSDTLKHAMLLNNHPLCQQFCEDSGTVDEENLVGWIGYYEAY